MGQIKNQKLDFDDSGYDTLKEENKYKKIADFHKGQMGVISHAIGRLYDEDAKEGIKIHNERVLSLDGWDRNPLE